MSETEEYNGWKNRETWAAALHLSNDEGLYSMVTEWAEEIAAQDPEYVMRRGNVLTLADQIEEFVMDLFDGEHGTSDAIDMMRKEVGSLWRVDWFDVAESFIEGALGNV